MLSKVEFSVVEPMAASYHLRRLLIVMEKLK